MAQAKRRNRPDERAQEPPPGRVAYTIPETAYVLGCSVPQVRNMLELGALPRTQIGRAVRVSRVAVEEFVNTGGVAVVRGGQRGVAGVRGRSGASQVAP